MEKRIATFTQSNAILERYGLRAKKSLGQNFLIEPNIIERIVKAAQVTANDVVFEVGPGLGALTQGLGEAAGQVVALEIDSHLIDLLREQFADCQNINIVHQDVMKANLLELYAEAQARGVYDEGFIVAANLPYYITTPIMMLFLESNLPWRRLVFMMQKEVAERLAAKAGSKEYGALTLAVTYRASVNRAFIVPPTVFYPRPNVDSAVVVLERLPQPKVAVLDEDTMFAVIKASFGQRRKTLLNALSAGLNLEKEVLLPLLQAAQVAEGCRGETLGLDEFARIADNIYKYRAAVLQPAD